MKIAESFTTLAAKIIYQLFVESSLALFGVIVSCISSLTADRTASPSEIRTSITIRAAQFDDVEGLAEVLAQSFHPRQGLSWIYPVLKLGIYEDLRSRLRSSSPHYACLVALIPATSEKEEEVIGTVEVALRTVWLATHSQYPYISNLAVKAAYRRQGIAQKLLSKCEQVAGDWGFQEISLHVLDNNEQARQLYSKSGYRLQKAEDSLMSWLFKRPQRLLLSKRFL